MQNESPPAAGGSSARHNARYGLLLFFIYLALYACFVGLCAFAPQRMGETAFGGLNLAIVYGCGLIGAALVLALVYMVLCRPADEVTELTDAEWRAGR